MSALPKVFHVSKVFNAREALASLPASLQFHHGGWRRNTKDKTRQPKIGLKGEVGITNTEIIDNHQNT